MRVITVHHTKENSLGIFRRRILALIHDEEVLLVTPCINPACPDLGFALVPLENLWDESYREIKDLHDLDPGCLLELEAKLHTLPLEETDSSFSRKWFGEIARVTELDKYLQKPFSGLLV